MDRISWHRRTVIAVATVLGILVLMPSGFPAGAQERGDGNGNELGLSAEFGFDGQPGSQGAWGVVTVTISPTVPVLGELVVGSDTSTGDGGRLVQRLEVEVAAGATEQVRLLVPPGDVGAEVSLRSGDRVASERADVGQGWRAAVGVLDDPDFGNRVGAVTDPLTDEVWTTVAVDSAVLELSPQALEALGTLVVEAPTLDGLGDEARQNLEVAVNHQGVHLLVTGVTRDPGVGRPPGGIVGGALELATPAWPLSVDVDRVERATGEPNGATIRSGRGRVTWLTQAVAEDALRSPRTWGWLWTATPLASTAPWERPAPVDPWLLRQQGLRLPSSWGMAAFVAAYLVIAGSVAMLVVRRLRRRERAWLVLPAVALVLAATAFVASTGNDVVGGRAIAAATWIEGSGVEEVVVLGNFDDLSPVLPGAGWQVMSLSWPGVGVRATPDGVALGGVGDEGFGEPGVAWGRRASPSPPPLALEAARLPGGVQVEVVNTSGVTLSSLRVVADGHVAGDLEGTAMAPGDTVVVDIDDVRAGPWNPLELVVDAVDVGPDPPDGGFSGRATLAGHVEELVADTPDLVWVLAVAEEVVPRPRGLGRQDAQVVAVGVAPTVDPDAPAPASMLVWGINGQPDFEGVPSERWIRFTPASPTTVDSLAIDLPLVDGQDCRDWTVSSDRGDAEVQTLCDGEQPECPTGADCFGEDGQFFEICDPRGPCEHWEAQGGGTSTYRYWDVVAGDYRPWNAQAAADVAADPSRAVTPLGDVVVQRCCGQVPLNNISVTTGGGS